MYLESFDHFENISLREKLESIVNMYEYLCEFDMMDSLDNYIGRCSILFLGNLKVNIGKEKKENKNQPYKFDIGGLLNKLKIKSPRNSEKIEIVEKLYSLSKVKKFDKTKDDVLELISPILNLTMSGYKIIDHFIIEQYYDGLHKNPCFCVKLYFDEELLSLTKDEIISIKRASNNPSGELSDVEGEFQHFKRIFRIELEKIKSDLLNNNLIPSIMDNHMNYYEMYIYLRSPIK